MRVMLVDFMGCFHWHHHAKERSCTYAFLRTLRTIVTEFHIDRTYLLLEGGSGYREKMYPEYKAARKQRRADMTAAEKREYERFRTEADELGKVVAPQIGLTPLRVYGAEADDIAAYICQHADTDEHQIMNLSGDKDWYQLLRRNVVQASYADIMAYVRKQEDIPAKVWKGVKAFEREYGIPVDQWIWVKCLAGDTSDSVKGFVQVGEGTAIALLKQYHSIEGIKENLDTIHVPHMKGVAKVDMFANFDRVYDNYRIMSLLHTPEEEMDIFKPTGITYLNKVLAEIDAPLTVDKANLRELCYEKGWIEMDEDWLAAFV